MSLWGAASCGSPGGRQLAEQRRCRAARGRPAKIDRSTTRRRRARATAGARPEGRGLDPPPAGTPSRQRSARAPPADLTHHNIPYYTYCVRPRCPRPTCRRAASAPLAARSCPADRSLSLRRRPLRPLSSLSDTYQTEVFYMVVVWAAAKPADIPVPRLLVF